MLLPSLRIEDAQHRDFVAGFKFRATRAILPGLQREQAAFHWIETEPGEKSGDVRESKDGVESKFEGFLRQGLNNFAPHPHPGGRGIHRKRTNFGGLRAVEMQRAASNQRVA